MFLSVCQFVMLIINFSPYENFRRVEPGKEGFYYSLIVTDSLTWFPDHAKSGSVVQCNRNEYARLSGMLLLICWRADEQDIPFIVYVGYNKSKNKRYFYDIRHQSNLHCNNRPG